MTIPSPRTVKYDIGNYVYRNPGTEFDRLAKAMHGRRRHYLRTLVDELLRDGLLVAQGDGLACALYLRQHFDRLHAQENGKPAVIAPPYRPAFKEYQPKPLLTREPLREISFVALSPRTSFAD